MRLLLLLSGLAASAAVAQTPAPAVPPHIKQLDGTYKPESVQYDGLEMVNPKTRSTLTLVIKDGEYRAYYTPDPAKDSHLRLFTATLSVDPATKTFELSVTDGQKKGEKRHGVLKHENGKLHICYGPADKPRPTAFATAPNSGLFCETWVAEPKK